MTAAAEPAAPSLVPENSNEGSSELLKDDDATTSTVSSMKSMEEAMNAKIQGMQQHIPKDAMEFFTRKLKEYAESPIFSYALQVGDEFPDFSLPDETGNKFVSSVDLLQTNKYLVVTFFRGGWCLFCSTSLKVFDTYVDKFQEKGCAIVGVAPSMSEKNKKMALECNLKFPILTDEHCEYAQTCNIAYEVDDELKQMLPPVDEYNGNDDWIIPMPATFVVRARDKKVLFSYFEVDPWKRAEPSDILECIEKDIQEQAERRKNRKRSSNGSKSSKKGPSSSSTKAAKDLSTDSTAESVSTMASTTEAEDSPHEDELEAAKKLTPLKDALLAEVERLEEDDIGRAKSASSSMRTIFREIRALKEAGIAGSARTVGQMAPEFKLVDTFKKNKSYDSKKLLLKKHSGPLVIVFIHGDWSSMCRLTLKEWNYQYPKLQAKGAHLIGVSPCETTTSESVGNVDFPVLWDEGNTLAKAFRLRYQMDAQLPGQTKPWPLPMPATYVVKGDGSLEILYAHVDCDHTQRAEPLEVLNQVPAGKITYKKKRGAFSLRLKGWLPIGKKDKA